MSAPQSCCTPSCNPEVVDVPGVQGEPGQNGTNGTDGVNAFTVTTANFVIPAVGAQVSNPDGFVYVADTSWMAVGQTIIISDGTDWGTFRVDSIPNSLKITATFLGHNGDAAPAATINSGAQVSPAGTQPALSGALPNALTDNSTGTASDTIAAGVGVTTLMFAIDLVALTAAAADLLTDYVIGYAFKILAVDFAVTEIGAGAGATMNLNLEIGAVNVTGGVVNPTLANTATLGALVAGTAVTANNTGTAANALSIEVAAGGTIFTAGKGVLLVKIQNMDTANAIASLSDHVNDLIAAL